MSSGTRGDARAPRRARGANGEANGEAVRGEGRAGAGVDAGGRMRRR
jgi:hypothetical protein